ncbi:efflux RND transporter permease subunit [Chitinophaga sancti]|uniref:Cobalt-zinc-cadmium resistance protein CzcA n=1 Tax=Chitinophaga sancti TaxID=1004 RepID=A0A1K1N845_9BACT|nr:CusA/CzcA family heavy metal efflux RND transporter [Chitinophaga sancti]WQD63472.1 CusA/CzcA family heavy metal efflux RND transporter [Chitinophaga sancti]WQG90902.1 CusA/CzcA family heavy metal efflux RND transporter [Chitinophaga sancti]SFW31495.1 cobalt-zinc-cadmium resistance protein CzcA [Chitinophaga sancti]
MQKVIKKIIAFSLKNRLFIGFATVILIVWGVIAFRNIPIEAFPDVTNTQITIITQWPGRSAEEVEKFVTVPVEIAMNPVQKKESVRSTTVFGLSVVKVIFEDGVDDAFARQQVNNLLRDVTLPDGADPDVQPPTGPTGEIFRYTLESKTKTVRELKTLQDWVIERRLLNVPGVGDVVSFGGEVKTYEIAVNPQKLASYDITPLDVSNAISKSNINVGGDVIVDNSQAYVVRGIGLLNNAEEIGNIIVDNINGTPILVKDIGTVAVSALPRLGQVGRDKQNDVVEGIIVMRKGENPSEVIKRVQDRITYLNEKVLPPDVKINTFYNRSDLIEFATHTVLHNMLEGIIFVTVIVFLFMADWRTTVIVAIVIPLALLFAFICLTLKGMSANLLSMGAIDFGIIIDGAVVMVEGIFVLLDQRAHQMGMERFNKLSKLGIIKNTGGELGKAIFFSKLIIIAGLLPIFSFQKVEGKMFSPLAWTLGFALLGALILTLTLIPLLSSLLLRKNVREKHNVFVEFITNGVMKMFSWTYRNKRLSLLVAVGLVVVGLFNFKFLGSEFLPELDEGAIYIRATCPLSVSLEESKSIANKMRRIILSYPEVKQVMSQTGRPNDGTDATGFYNIEFHVDIYPKKQWKSGITKEELIDRMQQKLSVYPGINLNFSQPIMDNVEEAVSGVKGSLCVKIYGDSLAYTEGKANHVYDIMKNIPGVTDLGVIRNIGQPELDIELDENKMALYGVTTADANAIIEMAIGGKAVTQIYEGERKFQLRLRYEEQYRNNAEAISDLMVPTLRGAKVPIKNIANIKTLTGPSIIFRDDNRRYTAVKFSVRGRDMGSVIAEAQAKVNKNVKLDKGYEMQWAGDFENQQRATKRLTQVVPISLMIIFLILFVMFGNVKDAGLVLINVPFAIIGGIAALLISGTNFSISAGIGFIALFGICIQNGVILISVFKNNMAKVKKHDFNHHTLEISIRDGVRERVRPVVMTALMAAIGLLPAALSKGIGSETSKPLAIVVIGGLITATVLTLLVFPLFFYLGYRKVGQKMD